MTILFVLLLVVFVVDFFASRWSNAKRDELIRRFEIAVDRVSESTAKRAADTVALRDSIEKLVEIVERISVRREP